MTIYQGWTPPEIKHCPRCGAKHNDQLYTLCDTCREGDKLAEYFTDTRTEEEKELDRLAKDEADTIKSIRPGC